MHGGKIQFPSYINFSISQIIREYWLNYLGFFSGKHYSVKFDIEILTEHASCCPYVVKAFKDKNMYSEEP